MTEPASPPLPPVAVVGVIGGEVFGLSALHAVRTCDVLVGSPRHLAHFVEPDASGTAEPMRPGSRLTIQLVGPLEPIIERVAQLRADRRRVCVLASGDPGFFGITRLLAEHLTPDGLDVHPAPSSVSLAWAAVGTNWDDADVVSTQGRPLADAIARAARSPKVAVLTSPASPPEVIGKELIANGCGPRSVVVASRIGEADQRVERTDLEGLARGSFDPLSVVLLIAEGDVAASSAGPALSWGASEDRFTHRAGMITKSEVRAIVLSKLELPRAGVMWDVGAGSGSVGIEAATIARGLRVYAVERSEADAANISRNSVAAGVQGNVDVIVGTAPGVLAGLPAPDRVFVGGGGLDVVEACWQRLRPGGVLVATFVVLDRAVRAMNLLSSMVQVRIDRAVPIGDVGHRFEPNNPTFVCWGRR